MTHSKRTAKVVVPFLLLILFALCLCLISSNMAAEAKSIDTEFKVAHITDMHIFIREYCNEHSDEYSVKENDGLALMSMSAAAMEAALKIVEEQEADYLLVTGDLTYDGARAAHLEAARILNEVQDSVRDENPDFQIFVIPGNHDIYNQKATSYMPSEAELAACASEAARTELIQGYTRRQVETVTMAEFFEIYAAFGYGEGTLGNIDYFYQSEYFYGIEDSDYTTALAAAVPTEQELTAYKDDATALDKASRAGGLSYIAKMYDGFTVVALDSNRFSYEKSDIYAALGADGDRFDKWGYLTAGDINENQLLWVQSVLGSIAAHGEIVVGMSHHAVVPHFDMEDDILTRFMAADWETASYVLADLGVTYIFTGHMHNNDIASYVSQRGNVIYDIETCATCTYGAAVRITEFSREIIDSKNYNDTVYNTLIAITSLEVNSGDETVIVDNLAEILNENVFALIYQLSQSYINEALIDKLKTAVTSISGKSLAVTKVGDITVSMLQQLIDNLAGLNLDKPKKNSTGSYSFDGKADAGYHLLDFAANLIDYIFSLDASCGRLDTPYTLAELAVDLYRTQMVGAEKTTLNAKLTAVQQASLSGDLVELVFDTLCTWLIPQLTIILDAPINMTTTPIAKGTGFDLSQQMSLLANVTTTDEAGKWLTNLLLDKNVTSLRTLLIAVPRLMSSISPILNGLLGDANGIVSVITEYCSKLTVKTNIGDFITTELIDKYATTALFKNLGSYVNKILVSFATDSTPDGAEIEVDVGGNWNIVYGSHVLMKLVVGQSDNGEPIYAYGGEFTYSGRLRGEENPATIEDGRLPSMLSSAFGENITTSKKFKWFTRIQSALGSDEQIDSYFIYWTKEQWENITEEQSGGTTVTATTSKVRLTIPLIDLGVTYITSRQREYSMHEVTLTGLSAGTTYYYKVGNGDYGWSETYTFTTLTTGGEVTVLGIADAQGSVADNYIAATGAIKSAISTLGNFDFVISAGDNVDKGSNTYQWEWMLNYHSELFANYSLVTSAGNHEDGDSAINSYLAVPERAVLTGDTGNVNGYYYSFDYSNVHFVVLNTNDLKPNGRLNTTQENWLKNDLRNSNTEWKVVVMHKGLYTAGSHAFDADVTALRAQLNPIFAANGVSLVLQGHDHTYSVSEYIGADGAAVDVSYDDTGNALAPQGVLYINMGTIGDKFYNYLYNDEVLLKNRASEVGYRAVSALGGYITAEGNMELSETPVFTKLHVNEGKLSFTSYAILDGEVIEVDHITILSDAANAVILPEAVAFSYSVSYDKTARIINNATAANTNMVSFSITTDEGVAYYRGYCMADFIDSDYISFGDKDYYTNSCYIALYTAESIDDEFTALTKSRLFTLLPYDDNHNMPVWLLAILISSGIAVALGVTVVVIIAIRIKKNKGKPLAS